MRNPTRKFCATVSHRCGNLHHISRSLCGLLFVWLCATAVSLADERPYRLLVLRSGRVVEGRISQSTGGYVVELPTGSMLLPFAHVRFEAENRTDAYHKLRRQMPDLTATNHLALARWCLSQNQLHAARTELMDALALEPDREEARQMLNRITQLTAERSMDEPSASKPRHAGFQRAEVEALAGLPSDLARTYSTRIQPLLLNKCGNARCHGGRLAQRFELIQRLRPGRHIVEQNLASVIEQINLTDPSASPLLVVPRGNHGANGQSVFYGRAGSQQLNDLTEWVQAVAAHRNPGSNPARESSTPAVFQDRGNLTAAQLLERTQSRPSGHSQTINRGQPRPSPALDRGRALINEVLDGRHPDAFDPDAFNRRFHTPTAATNGRTQPSPRPDPSALPRAGTPQPPTTTVQPEGWYDFSRLMQGDPPQAVNRPLSPVIPQESTRRPAPRFSDARTPRS